MPFDKVAEMMEELLGVGTTEETVRRLAEQAGGWMEAWQTAAIEANEESEKDVERPLERCVFSSDGAMVSLLHKQWTEVRTVAIGEPQEKRNASAVREVHVGKLSYFSRLADATTFTKLASVEIQRRRVREAKEVSAVMDRADWCQMFIDRHRPDAVRILDLPHAAEHINNLLEALERAKLYFPHQMLGRCLHILKHRGPRSLLRMADRIPNDLAEQKGIREHLDYLRKREALMQYPQFLRDGWSIGSGMVESANKNVVEARLKGTGMHWQRKNVNPMLALRNAVCNGRWREMWEKAALQQRKLQAHIRSAWVEQRMKAIPVADHAPSAVVSQSLSSSTPILTRTEVKATPVTSPSPERPRFSRSSSRRKRHTARKQEKSSSRKSSKKSAQVCLCGTPLVRLKGHRTRRYCSDRCRQRAHRERHQQSSASPLVSLPHGEGSLHASDEIHGGSCLCGTPLIQPVAGQLRKYCSNRCRQRAHRERKVS